MKFSDVFRCAGAACALAIVSGCSGGSTAISPPAAVAAIRHDGNLLFLDGRPVTAARVNPLPAYSQLVPLATKAKNYEYIFNSYQSYASIFDYPKSIKMIGQIQGAGGQGCTNVLFGYGKKTFWNAGRTNNVMTEYAVPDKQIRTLPIQYDYTSSCAMNTSGDLAVGILLGNSGGQAGQEVIFKKAKGKGIAIDSSLYRAFFAGYDPKGNLWADGESSSSAFQFAEIPKGAKKGVTITTSNSPQFPGSVQWDGKYVTVFDQITSETYQYTISGTKAKLVGTIQYTGASDCAQTWLVQGLMYCGDAGNNVGEVFQYPAGGAPIATFRGDFDEPLGTVAVQP